jgi:F420-non-reducing hydrogenase iron-sulfur subunit
VKQSATSIGDEIMTETETKSEPKITGFLHNWCSYAGADLAGVSRLQYPTNVGIIRVMCSGGIDPVFFLEVFKNGAYGVAYEKDKEKRISCKRVPQRTGLLWNVVAMSEAQSEAIKVNETIYSSQFDRGFIEEVRKRPGGKKIYLCYQCGNCAGGCPIGKITSFYKPRQIIRMTTLGLKDKRLKIDLVDLKGATCCALIPLESLNCKTSLTIAAYNLSLAEEANHPPNTKSSNWKHTRKNRGI